MASRRVQPAAGLYRLLPHLRTPSKEVRDEHGDVRCFLAAVEELTFTRAAVRSISPQQALSASIRRLDEQVGVRLFAQRRP